MDGTNANAAKAGAKRIRNKFCLSSSATVLVQVKVQVASTKEQVFHTGSLDQYDCFYVVSITKTERSGHASLMAALVEIHTVEPKAQDKDPENKKIANIWLGFHDFPG